MTDKNINQGAKNMMIEIHPDALDGLVRAWLNETLEDIEINAAHGYIHPDDAKQYKKDIKALKRILDYVGE
jgi:hypothetical protein